MTPPKTPGTNVSCGGQLPGQGQNGAVGCSSHPVRTGSLSSPGSHTEYGQTASQHTQTLTGMSVSALLTQDSRLHVTPAWELNTGGSRGPLAEGRGQPSSCPSPMHGSVPTSPCLIPLPQAEGAALLWPAPHQAPIASPTHAGLACRRDPGSSQGRAQCSHWDPNSPYLLFSPAPPAALALGSLEKTGKRSKN